MAGKIPDRWEDYIPMGTQVKGTRFITFKVPLTASLMSGIPADQHFTPDILLKKIQEQGLQLGLIIDLTNTFRYYKPTCLKDTNTKHVKIKTEGHVVPSHQVQRQFFLAVDKFLEENSDNDMLIGVHCTHCLNRTGYLLCRYMIDRLSIAPDTAIEAFNVARGHHIEREIYLEDLRSASTPIPTDDRDSDEEGVRYYNGHGRGKGRGGYRQRRQGNWDQQEENARHQGGERWQRQHDQRRQGNWDQQEENTRHQGGERWQRQHDQRRQENWDQQEENTRHQGGERWQRDQWDQGASQWGQGQWGSNQGQWSENRDWNYWYQDQWEGNSWGSTSYNDGGYNRNARPWQSSKGHRRGGNPYKWYKNSTSHLSNG